MAPWDGFPPLTHSVAAGMKITPSIASLRVNILLRTEKANIWNIYRLAIPIPNNSVKGKRGY